MKKMNRFKTSIFVLPLLASCSVDFKKIEKKAAMMNHYELVSLRLASENRELHSEIKRKEFEIEKLKQDKAYFEARYGKQKGGGGEHHVSSHSDGHTAAAVDESHGGEHGGGHGGGHGDNPGRSIASIPPLNSQEDGKKDFVEFKTYKWHADDLLQIADKEFKEKHYEKAAQFYTSLLNNYPTNKNITDEFYFKAGIASYESGLHHDWTIDHFEALMSKYPSSHYYRSARLWVALTHLKMGDKKKFYTTVEEFRKKYRNTNEWKILSSYYEKIEEKTNE